MKKALLYSLSLVLVLSLTACQKPQADQPAEPATTPAATSEPVQEPTTSLKPVADTTPEPEQTPAAPAENEDTQQPEDTTPQEPAEPVDLFTEVNETVWATGNVNLRSGPSTNDEKVGALNKGQSVTRIGIGTGDYSSWSKVKLSDGSEVYVASSYLTTTKPTTSKPSTGNPQQSGGNTQQTGGSGGSTVVDDPYAGSLVSGEEANKGMLTSDELDTGVIDPWQNADKIEIG